MSYKIFKRSCRNWKEFASAKKITVERGLTREEALDRCQQYNADLTPRQRQRGTKYEFTEE